MKCVCVSMCVCPSQMLSFLKCVFVYTLSICMRLRHSSLAVGGVFPLMSNHRLTITDGGNQPTGVLTAECAHFPMLSEVKGHPAATAAVVTTPRTQGLSCVAVHITGCMKLKQDRQWGALCVFD